MAASSIDLTDCGSVTFSIEVPLKAFFPIELRFESFSNSTVFSLSMLKNAASPIDVTLDGIVTFSIEVPVKVFLPIELRIESFSE